MRLILNPGFVVVRDEVQATSGGLGSFSYVDPSVYGNRQDRRAANGALIIPGSGGGARLPGGRRYGSRATAFNPNGVVLIRLYKVD